MSREDDAKIAELVFGKRVQPSGYSNGEPIWWQWEGPGYIPSLIPHYTSDAGADYEVLQYVREHWPDLFPFRQQLDLQIRTRRPDLSGWELILCYEPGDYSRAALRVLSKVEQLGV